MPKKVKSKTPDKNKVRVSAVPAVKGKNSAAQIRTTSEAIKKPLGGKKDYNIGFSADDYASAKISKKGILGYLEINSSRILLADFYYDSKTAPDLNVEIEALLRHCPENLENFELVLFHYLDEQRVVFKGGINPEKLRSVVLESKVPIKSQIFLALGVCIVHDNQHVLSGSTIEFFSDGSRRSGNCRIFL